MQGRKSLHPWVKVVKTVGLCLQRNLRFCRLNVGIVAFSLYHDFYNCNNLDSSICLVMVGLCSLGNYVFNKNSETCRNEVECKQKSPRNNVVWVFLEKYHVLIGCCVEPYL